MRQLRLRDIGGIIVIDFIDMAVAKNRAEVLKVLQEELEHDRTKTYLVEISPLGLVEMTRQNVTAGIRETLTRICPDLRRRGPRPLRADDVGRGRAAAPEAGPFVGLRRLPRPHERTGRDAARRPRRGEAGRA